LRNISGVNQNHPSTKRQGVRRNEEKTRINPVF
jgi:hypothetical protein